ncbi:MAG: hypothetical protein CMP60_03400 [Flavobacteriales bacterium]|nr:hypothetical protein [Flavobacteriales bacterium]
MSLYFKILFFSFIIPFLFSFHNKIKFNKYFFVVFITLISSSIPFILHDIYFTDLEVWGFHIEHHADVLLYNLPLEEILFFIVIPFCCLFIYFVFKKLEIFNLPYNRKFLIRLSLLLLIFGLGFNEKSYTLFVFLSASLCLLHISYSKSKWNGYFFSTYIIISLVPFLIVNGFLTGYPNVENSPVWYNSSEIIGFRFLNIIPIEDFFYNFVLLYCNFSLFEFYSSKIIRNEDKRN